MDHPLSLITPNFGVAKNSALVSEEGVKVPCHLLVLSGAASYFKGNWKEFKDSISEVQCSTEVTRNLVRFFYTSRLEDSSLDGQEETFLKLADYYQVPKLLDALASLVLMIVSYSHRDWTPNRPIRTPIRLIRPIRPPIRPIRPPIRPIRPPIRPICPLIRPPIRPPIRPICPPIRPLIRPPIRPPIRPLIILIRPPIRPIKTTD